MSQPNHPDASRAYRYFKVAEALSLFKTALDVNPSEEQFWISYIDALVKDNQVKKQLKRPEREGLMLNRFTTFSIKF